MFRCFILFALCTLIHIRAEAQNRILLRERVSASVYAKRFQGRKTASGVRFHHDSLTAAHKFLRLGEYLQVENPENDSSVIVKVTDRLGRRSRHYIDLSRAAARRLGIRKNSTAKVRVWHYFPSSTDTIPIP